MAAQLAIDGGPRTVPEGAMGTWPVTNEADRQAVLKVFDNEQYHTNASPFAQQLQRRWAEYCGVSHCLALNGGTGALHMALAACGVRAGDEVITSAYTYWSTASSILHQNAIPIFVDVDPVTAAMDPARIEERITPHTTAIVPVGNVPKKVPAGMDVIGVRRLADALDATS